MTDSNADTVALICGDKTVPLSSIAVIDEAGALEFRIEAQLPEEIRAFIQQIGDVLLSANGPCDLPTEHAFCDGMYIRRMHIPKGTMVVGKVHRKPCINFVEKGDIAVLTESGAKRVTAGFSIASPAGLQKLGYANEDTIFTNVFRTDETDLAKLEAEIGCDSYERFLALPENTCLSMKEA